MGIVSVDEPGNLRARSGSQDNFGRNSYVRVFRVVTDGPTVGAAAVRAAAGVPQRGTAYVTSTESDPHSFVQGIETQEESDDGLSWIVKVSYGPFDTSEFSVSPLDWKLRIKLGGNRLQKIVWQDNGGNPIVNSAFERFADPALIDDQRTTITVTRNELVSVFSLTLAELYSNKVNASAWNGFAPRTVKCGTITTSDETLDPSTGLYYYTVTYPFEVNRDTWDFNPLQQGYSYLDASTPPKRVKITDSKGQPPSEASLLDASGHVLATNGTPVFANFRICPEVDFAAGFNMDFSTSLGR